MPARTTLMIGTDANGHVGKHNAEVFSNVEDQEDLPSIGNFNPEVENGNGTQLRTFLNETGMVANTWKHQDLHGSAAKEINPEWTTF